MAIRRVGTIISTSLHHQYTGTIRFRALCNRPNNLPPKNINCKHPMLEMEALFLLLLFLPCVFSFGHVSARNSSGCPANYDHDTHWCASNEYGSHLCEIVDGLYYGLCGTNQCFNDLQYVYDHCPYNSTADQTDPRSSCNGITLSPPPKVNSTFYLSVLAPSRPYSFQYIQAVGQQFVVGGSPSTYCPLRQETGLCPYDGNTVFYSNALAVTVPGGQRIFIKEDGTLAFTQAHSAQEPDVAYDGENIAYSHAGYFGPDGHTWAACRPRGSSEPRRIVADLPGVDLETEDCEGVFLYVSELDQSEYFSAPGCNR